MQCCVCVSNLGDMLVHNWMSKLRSVKTAVFMFYTDDECVPVFESSALDDSIPTNWTTT